jgi:hypothetical protein
VRSVTFPAADGVAPAGSPTLSRSPALTPATPAPPPGVFSRPAPAAAPSELDVDELYEQVSARLRHELLLDRERVGDLVGELPGLRAPR